MELSPESQLLFLVEVVSKAAKKAGQAGDEGVWIEGREEAVGEGFEFGVGGRELARLGVEGGGRQGKERNELLKHLQAGDLSSRRGAAGQLGMGLEASTMQKVTPLELTSSALLY